MKLLFTLTTYFLLASAYCQTVVKGVIIDETGEPIPGANILIQNSYDGTSSAEDGTFSFESSESGDHVLIVKFVGYGEHQEKITLADNITLAIRVLLREEASELEAITITAGTFTASDESRRTVFKPLDIATTAGATADIAGALNTLPGTQKVGESGRLFVRGGDGSETRTFIDGMAVLDPYGPAAPNAPSRGRFLPFMFKGISFSTGGYSAEYGQALSSALTLDSKDESGITRTDIGILSVGGDVAHTQAWAKGSAAAKIQYTNIRPYFGLINQEIDWKDAPVSLEGVVAFRQRVGKDGMIKFFGNFNQSDFSLYQHDIDNENIKTLYKLKNGYRYGNASYKTSLNRDWSFRSGISYSLLQNDVSLDQNQVSEIEEGWHVKAVADGTLTDHVQLRAGAEWLGRNYDLGLKVSPANSKMFEENISALFAESDIQVGAKFIARTGARLEHNSLTTKLSVDPRVSLAYKAGDKGQFSVAYGKFRQTPKNEFLRRSTSLESEKAEHFILNYQYLTDNRTFRIETFYKKYEDLVKFDSQQINNKGYGFAKGIELFWRDNDTFKGVDYWVSYSFLDTKRNYLNYPANAIPAFASRHNFSLVAKYFVSSIKSQLGATWSYASGRAYNNPNEERFNGSKTPSYQDLSFNWSYLPKPYLIIYASCSNLLGRENIFGYEYGHVRNEDGAFNGRAIRQAAPRFVFLGIFITLSKNKSFNQLPSL